METVWYVLMGFFFATYFVLGGYDYGAGMLLPQRGASQLGPNQPGSNQPGHELSQASAAGDDRRAVLNAVGPFFLGNEVWLVASVGILFGAFPLLEGELLSGLYGPVVLAVLGVIGVTAAFQLRSRARTAGARAAWDRAIVGASVVATAGWGAVLGGWLQGTGDSFTPFVAVCALVLPLLALVHGSAFLALRLTGAAAERYARLGSRLVVPALCALAAATLGGAISSRVRESVQNPLIPILVVVAMTAALLAAGGALARRRPGIAFLGTALTMALPVLLVLGSLYPYALAPNLTVADAAAAPETLRILSWLALPLLPALIGFQAMCWWAFRGRLDNTSPVFY